MPIIGWSVGRLFKSYVTAFDHWIAFALLGLVGSKMLYEAWKNDHDRLPFNPMNLGVLFALSVATSIDALAVGLSLSFIDVDILVPVVAIGGVTFGLSFAGTYLGSFFGHIFERKMEIAGGVILIAIGVKILLEHTVFSGGG